MLRGAGAITYRGGSEVSDDGVPRWIRRRNLASGIACELDFKAPETTDEKVLLAAAAELDKLPPPAPPAIVAASYGGCGPFLDAVTYENVQTGEKQRRQRSRCFRSVLWVKTADSEVVASVYDESITAEMYSKSTTQKDLDADQRSQLEHAFEVIDEGLSQQVRAWQ